jgi:hypothetical protein
VSPRGSLEPCPDTILRLVRGTSELALVLGSAAIDFDAKHRPHLEGLLEPGEKLTGVCAATRQQGMFKGGAVAVGVADRRLIIQPLDAEPRPRAS